MDDIGDYKALEVSVEKIGDVHVFHLKGQVNELGVDVLSAQVESALQAGGSNIVFDLYDVSFMGSTGLGEIMRAYRAIKGRGFVRLAAPQALVADLFRLTKLDKLLGVYPTVAAALEGDA